MKNYLVLLLISFAVFLAGCKNPLEGFELRFKKALPVVREIQVVADNTDTLPPQSVILVSGPDIDRIVNPLNAKKFKLTNDGYLYLSLDSLAKPSAANPIRITVAAQAPNYFDGILPLEITNTDYQSASVQLLSKLGKPVLSEKNITGDQAGSLSETTTVSIVAPALTTSTPASLVMPKARS